MPDLMQILSIFLKLQAVKQSGPGFLGLPCRYIIVEQQNWYGDWQLFDSELKLKWFLN